jgi:hypothetical protein
LHSLHTTLTFLCGSGPMYCSPMECTSHCLGHIFQHSPSCSPFPYGRHPRHPSRFSSSCSPFPCGEYVLARGGTMPDEGARCPETSGSAVVSRDLVDVAADASPPPPLANHHPLGRGSSSGSGARAPPSGCSGARDPLYTVGLELTAACLTGGRIMAGG